MGEIYTITIESKYTKKTHKVQVEASSIRTALQMADEELVKRGQLPPADF